MIENAHDRGPQATPKEILMLKILFAAGVAALAVTPVAMAEDAMNPAQARAIVLPFYEALNAAPGKDAGALVLSATAEGWESCSGNDVCAPRAKVAEVVPGFSKAIPDLKWEIKEVLVAGNRVIVRGEGSGTPAADFMGAPHGGKSFTLMSIDIHTLKNGKMVGKSYHIEDWAGALRQLTAK
jgi:hypothetical protein